MRIPLGSALTIAGLFRERYAPAPPPPRPVRRIGTGDDVLLDTVLALVPCRVQAIWLEPGVGLMAQLQITDGTLSPYRRGSLVERPADCVLPRLHGSAELLRRRYAISYVPGGTRLTD